MKHGDLGPEILSWLLAHDGAYLWDIEKAFPARRGVRSSVTRLERKGFVRYDGEPHGVSVWVKVYRTGKPLGPQAKLTAFVEVPA